MGFLKGYLVVNGSEQVKGFGALLDNDDIRPLALKDRIWTGYTYFTFWFSAAATGLSLASLRVRRLTFIQSAISMAQVLLKPSASACGRHWLALSMVKY
jgi:hypothetical protein